MLTTYERRLVLSYLINAVRRLHRGTSETKVLFEWLSENSALLRPESWLVELCRARARRGESQGGLSKNQSGEARDLLTKGVPGVARRVRADRLAARLRSLGREMQLTRTDMVIIEIMLRYRSSRMTTTLAHSHSSTT